MGTKMKGIFKGLKCISHIFEDEKEEEFQIGFPTDVKHVAHIGWDGHGPSVDSPSWMKDFKSSTTAQSGPLAPPGGETREGANEIKWVSEDSKRVHRKAADSPSNDRLPDVPKSSRRSNHSKELNPNDSPKKKDSSTRSRRRSKDSSKGGGGSVKSSRSKQCSDESGGSVKSNRSKECSEEGGSVNASDQNQSQQDPSPPRGGLPDLPKKSPRGKKSKELANGSCGSTQSSSSELVVMNAPNC